MSKIDGTENLKMGGGSLKRSRWATPGASGEREVDRPRCATEAAKHHHHHIRQKPLPPSPSSARRQWPRGEAHPTEEAGINSQAPSFALAAAALPLLRKVRSLARSLPCRPAFRAVSLHHRFVVGLKSIPGRIAWARPPCGYSISTG
jgi:hypothetical protein